MALLLFFVILSTLYYNVSVGAVHNTIHARSRIIVGKNGQKFLVSYVHFQPMRNKRLLVKPITAVVVPNHQECRQACLKTTGCVSMNVKELNATYVGCELLDKDHFQKKRFFIDYFGSDYYVADVSISFILFFHTANGFQIICDQIYRPYIIFTSQQVFIRY